MSVSPACLGGDFVWTNSCCPVVGSGLTFAYSCDGDCRCTGCVATGYYAYEGYRLPATGGACGCGASGGTPPGENDDRETDPQMSGAAATFTKRVILFEDDYDNAPGEHVPWRSTETELVCRASGGIHGGRVRIEITGADGLVPYGGRALPFVRELDSGETVAFKNAYRAVRPSGGEDDIVVTTTFEENVTGWTWTSESKATAVKLRFKPQVSAPENDCEGRHRYGIRELVDCIQLPSAPRVTWALTAGEINETARQYKCPLRAASNPITVSCGDAEYTPTISVIEPQAVSVRTAPSWDDFDAPIGEAGQVVMYLPLSIEPMSVSFASIAVEEVPHEDHPNNEDIHTGYFARKDLSLWWHHTRLNGAGKWRDVKDANRMGGENVFDQAGITKTLSRVNSSGLFVADPNCGWSDGRIVMATPFGWNETNTRGDTLPYKKFATGVRAILELQTNGTFRVEKLDNTIVRQVGGEVFLNGVRQK